MNLGPGRTPPRLVKDIYQHTIGSRLADPPPVWTGAPAEAAQPSHAYYLNEALSTPTRLEAVCKWTFNALTVLIDGQNEGTMAHFHVDPDRRPSEELVQGRRVESTHFISSSNALRCSVRIQEALIPSELLHLAGAERLERVYREVQAQGLPPTPYTFFLTMSVFVSNALRGEPRVVPPSKPQVQARIGTGADAFFEWLHFRYAQDQAGWVGPDLTGEDEATLRVRNKLQAVYLELCLRAKAFEAPAEVRQREIKWSFHAPRAEVSLYSAFAVQDYTATLHVPDPLFYTALGVVADMPDDTIVSAYERQCAEDAKSASYYLECLEQIARYRDSEDLLIHVAKARSEGAWTRSDLAEAYRFLGAETDAEESVVIGLFKGRLADGPAQESLLREGMRIIGTSRGSAAISALQRSEEPTLDGAYARLQVEPTTSDDLVLHSFQMQASEQPQDASLRTALKVMARSRASSMLLNFVEQSEEDTGPPVDDDIAFARIGVEDRSLGDDELIEVFLIRVEDQPDEILNLRAALRAIATSRKSGKIRHFLATGDKRDPPQEVSFSWPVGLENIGNTCYLNSLMQFYFTVKPLRETILGFDPAAIKEEELDHGIWAERRIGGRRVSPKEILRARKFVVALASLFHDLIHSHQTSVTPERELAYLALVSSKDEEEVEEQVAKPEERRLQIITEDPQAPEDEASDSTLVEDRNRVNRESSARPPPAAEKEDEDEFVMIDQPFTPEERDRLFPQQEPAQADAERVEPEGEKPAFETPLTPPESPAARSLPNQDLGAAESAPSAPVIPPRPANTRRGRRRSSVLFGKQQDVAECVGNCMFQIESAIQPSRLDESGEQLDVIKSIFFGKTMQVLELAQGQQRQKEEYFSHLLVDVGQGRSLYAALDAAFDAATVSLDGQTARRYLLISSLPPVLQVQVQRVQYDRNAGRAFKSNAHLAFPSTIYLDRYLSSSSPRLQALREEVWGWKGEMEQLEARKQALTSGPVGAAGDVLTLTCDWLSQQREALEVPGQVLSALDEEAAAVREEVQALDARLQSLHSQVDAQFGQLLEQAYSIHSVFIHRGGASFGHYWIYIYDRAAELWRKYNDGYVTQVGAEEVFGESDGNPYMLVYVRDPAAAELVECVKRESDLLA